MAGEDQGFGIAAMGDPIAQRMMTHYAPQPNPAAPYIQALQGFLSGGLQGAANSQGIATPDWSKSLGALLTRPEANAALGVMTPLGSKGITAFHGSPHDFDRFDLAKIGTGEGAQAYGHGLYFAENKGVAKSYQNDLTKRAFMSGPAGSWLERAGGDPERAIKDYEEAVGHLTGDAAPSSQEQAIIDATKAQIRQGPAKGATYQVSINADPEHFLDWDKPLSEQSSHIRSVLKNLGIKETVPTERFGDLPLYGQHVSDRIANDVLPLGQATEENITKTMREAGIPGIKYLDQGSRFAGTQGVAHLQDQISQLQDMLKTAPAEKAPDIQRALAGRQSELAQAQNGTRNYVVFDDKLIDIMKKYGIAGIGALPALGAYHFQDAGLGNSLVAAPDKASAQ